MKYYHSYMNRQEISPEAHEKLLSLETPAKARRTPWAGVAALAACCALAVGLALWRGGHPAPTPPPVSPGTVSSQEEAPSQSNEAFRPVTAEPNDSQKLMLPMIPYINYQELDTAKDVAMSIALAEGSFSRELTQAQIQTIFWGPEGRPEADHLKTEQGGLPWMLFWDGYALHGYVLYDGGGHFLWLHLFGEHPHGPSFHLQLALDSLPPTCCLLDSGLETSEVFGTEVVGRRAAYDQNGDGVIDCICTSEFMAGKVGVRFENTDSPFQSGYEMAMGGACQFNALFVRQALIADGGLYLDHLAVADDVPEWRSADFDSLAQAREEPDFAPYLPQAPIPGYGEFNGRMTYQEDSEHVLWVRWSRGYDDVSISICLPEGDPWWGETVDAANPASYDTRLYTTPWADSVPQEYRENFYRPHFRAEDMSLDIVKARGTEKDTGGMAYRFGVIHGNGALVEYDCSGLTAEAVWTLVEATLP